MAKKAYVPYDGQSYSTALGSGKLVRLEDGEVYETANEDEQRELDLIAAQAGSGLKVSKGGK